MSRIARMRQLLFIKKCKKSFIVSQKLFKLKVMLEKMGKRIIIMMRDIKYKRSTDILSILLDNNILAIIPTLCVNKR